MTKPSGEGKAKRSLVAFARDKKREKCKVCQVPEEVRREMTAARDKKITQDILVLWLKSEHGVDIASDDLQSHHAGHHDRQLKELETP